jgi:8-oxo-dGTP pyrophosphatase MutT (NUDIX family)
MAQMIEFENADGKFIYRAAAVIIRRDEVLLHTFGDESFWIMPGGRMEMHEPARECVRREIVEEMDLGSETDIRVGRLLWLVENMFEQRGVRHHECGLYFEANLPMDSVPMKSDRFTGHEWDGSHLPFQWFPIGSLADVELLPSFLRTGLREIPEHTEYVLHIDSVSP